MREGRYASLAIFVVEDEEVCRLLTAGDLKSISELIFFTRWYLHDSSFIEDIDNF